MSFGSRTEESKSGRKRWQTNLLNPTPPTSTILFVPVTGVSPCSRESDEVKGRRNRMRARVMTAMEDEEASSDGISRLRVAGVREAIL
jgi:hypothetical protein